MMSFLRMNRFKGSLLYNVQQSCKFTYYSADLFFPRQDRVRFRMVVSNAFVVVWSFLVVKDDNIGVHSNQIEQFDNVFVFHSHTPM